MSLVGHAGCRTSHCPRAQQRAGTWREMKVTTATEQKDFFFLWFPPVMSFLFCS